MSTFLLISFTFLFTAVSFASWQIYLSLKSVKMIYRIAAVLLNILCAGVFIVRLLVDRYIPQYLMSYFSEIGYGWFYVISYTIMFFVGYYIVMAVDKAVGFIPADYKLQSARGRFIGFVLLCVMLVVLLVVGRANFTNIDVIYLEKSADKGLDRDFRAVFVSDIHLGDYIDVSDMEQYIDTINSLDPDVVIIGGDLFDKRITPLLNQNLEEALTRFKTRHGVYLILGNHEYYGMNIELIGRIAERANITVLRDSYAIIDDNILILGRDDRHNYDRADLDDIISADSLKRVSFSIAVDHQPTDLDEAVDMGFDYIFAGHTHKGQFWPGNYIVTKVHKYAYGLYTPTPKSSIYVSSGLGVWGPKYRIGSSSEIIVLDVRGQ